MGASGRGRVAAVLVVLAVLVAAGLVAAQENTLKLGFVDVQKVLNESAKGKEAKAKLEKERDAKQQDIRAKEEDIKKLEADLQKQGAVLSEAARKERQETINRKIRDLRRLFEDFNRDLQKRETELLNEILREIRRLVVAYGKEQKYTLILEAQSGIIYASQGADLTDEVLAAYNQRK
ncbi:MAG: OmpH family outer membrane protein [candidate division NC10 bacterium]|nr:OmpH family outer membrane protein [candidate division NC10 bacterium]